MNTLEDLIAKCIERKNGDKEFALHYLDDGDEGWLAQIGNPVRMVLLGESDGEYRALGPSAVAAVQNLLKELEQ